MEYLSFSHGMRRVALQLAIVSVALLILAPLASCAMFEGKPRIPHSCPVSRRRESCKPFKYALCAHIASVLISLKVLAPNVDKTIVIVTSGYYGCQVITENGFALLVKTK